MRLAAASAWLWWELPGSGPGEGQPWLARAAAAIGPDTPPELAGRIQLGLAWPDLRDGDPVAAEAAVAALRATGDAPSLGAALWRLGAGRLDNRFASEAAAPLAEAETLLRRHGPGRWLALCLATRGDLAAWSGEPARADAAYREALAMSRALGQWAGEVAATIGLADLHGDASALAALGAALPAGQQAPCLAVLAAHLLVEGMPGRAAEAAGQALGLARLGGYAAAFGWAMEVLALVLADRGATEAAARFAGFAHGVHPAFALRPGPRGEVLARLLDRLDALDGETRARCAAEGAGWSQSAAAAQWALHAPG